MKVITVSRNFPKGHVREGEQTHFVQKILHSLVAPTFEPATQIGWPAKYHTIRAGARFKVGEKVSIRVWSGVPYRSKQEEICQLEVKKIWQFVITDSGYFLDGNELDLTELVEVAKNDGLSVKDFESWFQCHPKKKGDVFKCQIICWSDKIDY